jgi:hypothetical protein
LYLSAGTLKGDDGGDGLDAELSGDLRLIIDVHLDESSLAARAGDHTLDYRAQLLAGSHQGAQKSTSTTWRMEGSRTSSRKLSTVVSTGPGRPSFAKTITPLPL